MLAEAIGLPAARIELIRLAAPLHDIGKVAVPDPVLLKPGRLDTRERGLMRSHTAIGGKILAGSRSAVLRLAEEIALTHHERWDGGYPRGLAGEEIPLSGRLVAIADAFDALTHTRPYKEAWAVDQAVAEIVAGSGSQFDPALIKAFCGARPRRPARGIVGDGPRAAHGARLNGRADIVARLSAPFRHRLRVRYHECDPQGIVFNANYLAYADIAITELYRDAFGSGPV